MFTQEQLSEIKRHGGSIVSLFEFQFLTKTEFMSNWLVDRKFGDDTIYTGMHGRIEIPNVAQSRTGQNAQEVILISGLPIELAAMVNNEKSEVVGRPLIQRQQILNSDTMQPIGPPRVVQTYVMRGPVSVTSGGTVSGDPPVSSIGLKIETHFASRSQAGFGRYTTQDQNGRYPNITDNIFQDVPDLANGRPLTWP